MDSSDVRVNYYAWPMIPKGVRRRLLGLPLQVEAEDIIRIVCVHLCIQREHLNKKSRQSIIVKGRQICWHLTEIYLPNLTLKQNGMLFGDFDHTTVIHNRERIQNLIDTETELEAEISMLKDRIDAFTGKSEDGK